MNNINTHNAANMPKEALELLPWFVTGKLSVSDQILFENALETNSLLQQQLEFEQQMIESVSADKSLLEKRVIAPPEERLKAVFNIIDNPEQHIKIHHGESKLIRGALGTIKNPKKSFESFIPNISFSPQYAVAAGISALVLSVAVLSSIVIPTQTDTSEFSLASAEVQPMVNPTPIANVKQIILLVGFSGTKVELSNNDVLKGMKIKINNPADKEDFFQISFKDSINTDEIKQMIDALLAQETVWFAGEAF